MGTTIKSIQVLLYLTLYVTIPIMRGSVLCYLIDGRSLQDELSSMKKGGLGVDKLQEYFDTLTFTADIPNGQTLLDNLADKLSSKFEQRITQLQAIKSKIESQYANFPSSAEFSLCCKMSWLTYDERFNMFVSKSAPCEQVSSTADYQKKHLNKDVFYKMKGNLDQDSSLKWQYYGDESGVMTIYPANKFDDCDSYDPRYRPWYVAAATPTKKEVVIVIDKSGSMSSRHNGHTLMDLAKKAANTVLETLGPDDLVAVVAFSSSAQTPGLCFSQGMAKATPQSISQLVKYVTGLYQGGSTSYVAALSEAFRLLEASSSDAAFSDETREKVILFLSDGEPNESESEIMKELRTQNAKLGNKVILLTYGLGSSLSYSAQNILQKMANQETYNSGAGVVQVGVFKHISDPSKLRSSMASYYNFFSKAADGGSATVSVPYFDAFGLGMITTVSLPVYQDNDLKGVIGIDIPLSDLFSEAIFNRHYIFVIDKKGRTLIHPLLPRPDNVSSSPVVASIEVLEQNTGLASVLASMMSGGSGDKSLDIDHIIAQGDALRDGVMKQRLPATYYWKAIPNTDFAVCVVIIDGDVEPHISMAAPSNLFLYHRIDKIPPSSTCRHFERVSTMESSVVKFSAQCFEDPYQYLDQEESTSFMTAISNYMMYKTSSNPGLKSDIRSTVNMLQRADEIWLKDLTEMAKYLAWRYIATYNGVFKVIPGVKLEKNYNPVERPWYRRAMSQPGKTVLSTPYLDAFGAGYIITLSYTLFKGNSSGMHSPTDTVIAMAGADFTMGYFYQTLMSNYPICTMDDYSCYVIDSSGYIVIHEDFVQAASADYLPEVEYVHITARDEDLSKKLIAGNYMTKQSCLDVAEMKEQSTWKIDLGYKSQVEFFKDSSVEYEVWSVPGSNVFIVVRTRNKYTYGCVCSKKSIDSVKELTCSNADNYCECPCWKEADYEICKNQMNNQMNGGDSTPPCTPSITSLDIKPPSEDEKNTARGLAYCYQETCNGRDSESYCMSLLGCSWCSRDDIGRTLSSPYCAAQDVCYFGVVGMDSPYGDDDYKEEEKSKDKSNIGPIIGGVGGLIGLIFICCGVWKHKQRVARARAAQTARNTQTTHTNLAMVGNTSLAVPPPSNATPAGTRSYPTRAQAAHLAVASNPQPGPYSNVNTPYVPPYNPEIKTGLPGQQLPPGQMSMGQSYPMTAPPTYEASVGYDNAGANVGATAPPVYEAVDIYPGAGPVGGFPPPPK